MGSGMRGLESSIVQVSNLLLPGYVSLDTLIVKPFLSIDEKNSTQWLGKDFITKHDFGDDGCLLFFSIHDEQLKTIAPAPRDP